MRDCRRTVGAKKLRPTPAYAAVAAAAADVAGSRCDLPVLIFSGFCRWRKEPRVAARMLAWGLGLAIPDDARGRPFGESRLANAASVSRMNEISYGSSMYTELLVRRSASIDARPAAH